MSPAFVDRLQPLVRQGDVDGALALLASLDGTELREAQRWFSRSGRWLDSMMSDAFVVGHHMVVDRWYEANWILDLCAVHLCGPVTAARRVRWGHHPPFRADAGERALIADLCARDRDWAAAFVDEASRARLRGPARVVGAEVLTRVLRTVGRHHQLPCPTGATFYRFWLAGCPEDAIADRLANDPWLPELLDNYLASGHCGNSRDLPPAIATLLGRGLLDRTSLLGHILSLLTAPQRPSSQQVLARIVAVLAPTPDEISGGLDYLLGVMSTSVGAVGRVLLPLAVALLASGDDLAQLTAVVAVRPEQDQKARLLNALKELPARLGAEPVLASLAVLVADTDAALGDRARALAAGLAATGGAAAAPEADPAGAVATLGLWNLKPTRHGPITRPMAMWAIERVEWSGFFTTSGRTTDAQQRVVVDDLLTALAEGRTNDLDAVLDTARTLLCGGDLVMSRLVNLLPDLFLGGGMREVWPRALAFADFCAARLTQPPTLADLLRTLSRFAAEAPQQELPAHLRVLAARKGSSKAQAEARVLGATLLGRSPRDYAANLIANPPASPPPRSAAGLWREARPSEPLPEDIPLPLPEWTSGQLVETLAADGGWARESQYPLCLYPADSSLRELPHTWTPELTLAATVRAIHAGCAGSFRPSLAEIHRRDQPQPIVAAIDLWAAGLLDVRTFWRLALESATVYDGETSKESLRCWKGEWGRVGDQTGFTRALAPSPGLPVVRPSMLAAPVPFVTFLRACEGLLLAERQPVVLATPSWQDGTLDLDVLISRLAASGDSGVGPLDLVQALYRLRPADPARAAQVPVGVWFTDPALSTPEGGRRNDAGELVRRWVAAGGLPALAAEPDGRWESAVWAPVPWSTCAAAPAELGSLNRTLGSRLDLLRTFPLWPDLAIGSYGGTRPEDAFPAGARGPFGTPLHARLLGLMSQFPDTRDDANLRTFVLLAQAGRLDPAAAGAAMGWSRHRRGQRAGSARNEYPALAHTFARIFAAGGMVGAWPTALAVGVAGCGPEHPLGLDEFLRMLADYAIEVPAPRASTDVLEALRTFAGQPDRDAAHEQARALLTELEDAGAPHA